MLALSLRVFGSLCMMHLLVLQLTKEVGRAEAAAKGASGNSSMVAERSV